MRKLRSLPLSRTRPGFGGDRHAAAALEFAIVSLPMGLFLFGLIGFGIHFFLQQSLDYAVQEAGRQVEIGQIGSGYTESDFVQKVICPNFLGACNGLYVDLHPVSDYTSLAGKNVPDAPDNVSLQGFLFNTGSPGQTMYLHVVLQSATPLAALLNLGSNGDDAIVANAPFVNENPTGACVTPPSNC